MDMRILILGAGDLASGVALRLVRSGFLPYMTELQRPTSIRRTVCFSEAVVRGIWTVEDVTAERACPENADTVAARGHIPVMPDDDGSVRRHMRFDAVVDARIAKRNTDLAITDAQIVIGVGPGFTAGTDCHAVIETQRGHTLGRALYTGSAAPNTGVPGDIGGYTVERLIQAPHAGVFHPIREIGDAVAAGAVVAYVDETPVACRIGGILRGILPDGAAVTMGMKSGDVDPRCVLSHCFTVSDKALAVGGGVLEALLHMKKELRL